MSRLNRDQLVALAKSQIIEWSPQELKQHLDAGEKLTVVDIRERDEFVQGHLPSSTFIPRGHLELQIEQHQQDREAPVVIYCAGGVRSALAARNLQEMGYENVISLIGGFNGWKNAGYDFKIPTVLTEDQRIRYSRHTILSELGEAGQIKLLESKVLLIGAGGLGSPAAIYLAAAGVGTLGIVDFDTVDVSNLQRQILHGNKDVGRPKVESARDRIHDMNPDVKVIGHMEPITSANAFDIIKDYDIVLNGSDNFPTRYLVNDACQFLGKPLVDASIFMFEGQVTVYDPNDANSPCYRCLYPDPPPPGEVPSCAEGGVLGVLPGIVGSLQAVEAIKMLAGIGEPLIGRLLMIDTLDMSFRTLKVRKNPECPVCGEHPTVTELIDYEQFCGLPSSVAHPNGETTERELVLA
ncbi:MAG: molybdopterin-synthase adenylyltransferase MoeB [Caldilineaceae bacterium]|nr:molybdopterin-synthase adenylyltransferase MoeB [Caldilineaceae bacterium]MCB0095397.1 molybdopterin-synthase adenylyltransferase MoeB [Caldilineaceae bacterium]MCB0141214.1 molybdopterin-synthase adenylyltransferase MoeB [Caldilineaceae bacterium]